MVLAVVGCSSTPVTQPSVPRPDGQASMVARGSSDTRALGIDRWDVYAPDLTDPATQKSYAVVVVGVTTAGQAAESMRVTVQKDGGDREFVVEVYRDGGWNERVHSDGKTAWADSAVGDRTREIAPRMLADVQSAADQAKTLGTSSAGTPYDDGCSCKLEGWGFGLAAVLTGVAMLTCPVTGGGGCVVAGAIALGAGGPGIVVGGETYKACKENAKSFDANCKGDKVVRIQGQCSCICAPGYKGDPPDCKQDCPVCPCNIIGTAGTLQCDLVNLKQLDVPVGTTLACITPEYPVQHTWMNKVYCCPNYQPLPNGLCSDSKY
jgi:hypothetical protein